MSIERRDDGEVGTAGKLRATAECDGLLWRVVTTCGSLRRVAGHHLHSGLPVGSVIGSGLDSFGYGGRCEDDTTGVGSR